MIDSILLTPVQGELTILVKGDLAVMLAASGRNEAAQREQLTLVAGACNRRYLQLWGGAA